MCRPFGAFALSKILACHLCSEEAKWFSSGNYRGVKFRCYPRMTKSPKPHILIYAPTPPPYAGPEVATGLLLEAISGEKIRVTHVRSNIRAENGKKGVFDLEGIIGFLKVYWDFLHALRRTRPDKVYFLLSSGKVGLLRDTVIIFTAKLLGKRAIAHYRGGSFRSLYEQYGKLFCWLIRHALKHVDAVIVQAEILKSLFAGLVPRERLHVLYNGLPLNGYYSPHASAQKPFTLLFMGHVAFSKGFYELVLAYQQLRQRHPVRLLFAGEKRFAGDRRKAISAFLSGPARTFFDENSERIERVISDFVEQAGDHDAEYLGVVSGEAKTRAFAEADVFVLPSYTEGFSMSVLEAMAHGLPVVVTPVGALPEVVVEGTNGIFVQPGNSDDLAEKLDMLVRDRTKARAMGAYNAKYAAERFDITCVARQFEEILWRV
ncbi:glycosyltransferase family 4 protein [Cytophagia bacterium CHB2]|nr:glycosyltransferase family 4 protein [Cytophagia bacterium CHB2]